MIVASIDVETTGLDPSNADLLSIGCVIFDTLLPEYAPYSEIEFFVRHERLMGHPAALAMNIELIKHWAAPDRLELQEISQRMLSGISVFKRVVFAGKNFAGFDAKFLAANLYTWPELQTYGGHRTLDPGSMYALHSDPVPPNLKECCARAGVDYDEALAHSALYDAQCVAKCIYNFFWRLEHGPR